MREPFDKLKDSDAFEELCFDLLDAEGFNDLCWRGPSADGGRDIEAKWHTPDPAGGSYTTKWFIECKWYTDSVPYSEIEPKLLAADAAKVDYLLLMTSSMVRNTALDSVANWISKRGEPFRFRYWTGRDLLHRMVKHDHILMKHFPKLDIPSWTKRIAQLTRLESISRSGLDRQNWRVIPSIQWCRSMLRNDIDEATLSEVRNELDLLASTISLGMLVDNYQHGAFSRRKVCISDCVKSAIQAAERKAACKIASVTLGTDIYGLVSYPLLLSAIFELIYNALCYSNSGNTSIILTSEGVAWLLRIENDAKDTIQPGWPLVGIRGDFAKHKNVSGQGIGCWLTAEAMRSQDISIEWVLDGNNWKVSLKGGIER